MAKESEIQRVILDYLRARPGVFVVKIPNGPMYVKGGRRAPNPLKGMPDIHMLYRKRAFYLEVKLDKATALSAQQHQRDTQDEIRAAGGIAVQVDCLDDVIANLDSVDFHEDGDRLAEEQTWS